MCDNFILIARLISADWNDYYQRINISDNAQAINPFQQDTFLGISAILFHQLRRLLPRGWEGWCSVSIGQRVREYAHHCEEHQKCEQSSPSTKTKDRDDKRKAKTTASPHPARHGSGRVRTPRRRKSTASHSPAHRCINGINVEQKKAETKRGRINKEKSFFKRKHHLQQINHLLHPNCGRKP